MNTASGLTFIGWLGPGQRAGRPRLPGGAGHEDRCLVVEVRPDVSTGGAAPVTYQVNGKQYISVAVGGQAHNDVSRPLGLTNPKRLRDDAIYTFTLP